MPGALHLIAREELADEQVDGFLDRNETDTFLAVRQPDESLQRHWKAQQRRHFLAIAAMAKLQRNREAEIGNEGERMRRIDGERRQHRENLFVEVLFQPVPLVLRQGVRGDALNALRLEQNQKVGEALMLVFLQPPHLDQQLLELLLRGAAIGTLDGDALPDLAGETRYAHHEELIEIRRRNRQEAHAFQQGVIAVVRFFQDAPVELKPGEFAVYEAVRISAVGLRRRARFSDEFAHDRAQFTCFQHSFSHCCASILSPRRQLRQFDFTRLANMTDMLQTHDQIRQPRLRGTEKDEMAGGAIPHFQNDDGHAAISIGVKEFMCVGANPPFDHPHVYLDMGSDDEKVCPYCSTLFRYDPALKANESNPDGCLYLAEAA